jgi:hypothetical protein
MFYLFYNNKNEPELKITCDTCGRLILNSKNGLIIFKDATNPVIKEFQIVHHGECAMSNNKDKEYPACEELYRVKGLNLI